MMLRQGRRVAFRDISGKWDGSERSGGWARFIWEGIRV
jgi:hypothetical protein